MIITCRDEAQGKEAAEEIKLVTKKDVTVMMLDLTSFKSIREFVDYFNKSKSTFLATDLIFDVAFTLYTYTLHFFK